MSDEINKFEVTCESIGGAPAFVLKFHGDTVRGELAGARLYGENEGDGRTRLSLTAADGEVLADLTVHPRAHRDQTENIIDIASALLWSHWRWAMAKGAEETPGAAEGARDGARARLDGLAATLYGVAASLDANLPVPAERYAEDAAQRVVIGVSDLQRAHAALGRSRDRFRAQYRKAEARVAVLTEERDGLTLRLGERERKRVQRGPRTKGGR